MPWATHESPQLIIFFFFSSRRRHTRLTCDWSSDVCSSDLERRRVLDGCRVVPADRLGKLVEVRAGRLLDPPRERDVQLCTITTRQTGVGGVAEECVPEGEGVDRKSVV